MDTISGSGALIHNTPDNLRVNRAPLRSQKEKGTIEERLEVFTPLPKRREPLGFYSARAVPSKVDCFRKKTPMEASQG